MSWTYYGGYGGGGESADGGGDSWWSNIPWGDIFRAGAGAYAGYQGARQEEKAREGAGEYQGSESRTPWGPSVPYRNFGMERALHLLGLGGQGGGGGGGATRGWQGPQQETTDIMDWLQNRGEEGHPLYGSANSYLQGTLAGEDQNPYRRDLYNRMGDLNDPDLQRFKDMLFAGQMPGTQGQGVGDLLSAFQGAGLGRGGGGGGGMGQMPVGAAEYIKEILEGKFLEGNPFLDESVEAATRGLKEDFYERELPGILGNFGGSGRFGGAAASQFAGQEAGKLANAMGDIGTRMRSQDYESRMGDLMQALGLGTNLDMNAADNAARMGAANASAGASRFGSQMGLLGQLEGLASRERMGRMGALQGAIGQGIDLSQFGLAGQQGLAGLFSQDQNFGLSMIPEISGLDIRDMQAAMDPRMMLEQLYFQGAENQANRGMQAANRRQNRPWEEAAMYADLINAMSGGYYEGQNSGFQNNWSPYMGNPWQQAVAGGLGGYYGDWGSLFGGPGENSPQGQGPQDF